MFIQRIRGTWPCDGPATCCCKVPMPGTMRSPGMIPWFHVPTLEGSLVRLESLSFNHAEDLAVAAEENRSSYDFTLVPRADEVGAYVAAQFERAEQGLIPFA